MGGHRYDAIVVGARCAGAPTAMLLARRGYDVLLVDRARFPSDVVSTHHLVQDGAARLASWGLLEPLVAAGVRPIPQCRVDIGSVAIVGQGPAVGRIETTFCPRRTVLDDLLVSAAVEAGAELREAFTVTGLLWDGDRVVGVTGRSQGGAEAQERASIVIGADGKTSRVARLVAAAEYKTAPTLSCGYYSYWSGVDRGELEFYMREGLCAFVFPTNDGLACVYVGWPRSEFARVRGDVEANYLSGIEAIAGLGDRVRAGQRHERFRGTGTSPNYYRHPYGPGWALVGDAGFHRDQTTGQGMSDAMRDAEALANALDQAWGGERPLETALASYVHERDEATRDMYAWTLRISALPPITQRLIDFYSAARDEPYEVSQIIGGILGTVSPLAAHSRRSMERVTTRSLDQAAT